MHFVAAASNTFVTLLYADGEDPWTERQPVCAWRINHIGTVATPVLAEEITNNAVLLIELPDGGYCRPGISNYSNLEDAITHHKIIRKEDKILEGSEGNA